MLRTLFQAVIDTCQTYIQWLGQLVSDVAYYGCVQIWTFMRYGIELIWNGTLGIAYTTLSQLFENMGFTVQIDFSTWLYWFEVLNFWLPVGEAIDMYQGMYAWYLFAFAYRWIKSFIPFT